MLVDACSMHLITQPTQFDVIVTENLFGDILSDEASVIPGSLGLSPSASFGQTGTRLYEPIHGSAPDIANEDKANPFGMVLSLALCLRESLNQNDAANELESIVYSFIQSNKTTADLGGQYRTSEIFKLLKENIYKRRRKLWVKHCLIKYGKNMCFMEKKVNHNYYTLIYISFMKSLLLKHLKDLEYKIVNSEDLI